MATSPGYSPGTPGFSDLRSSIESSTLFQTFFQGDVIFEPGGVIASTALDPGNTPTMLLRPGLVLARLDADGTWVDYDEDAEDGSQDAQGILVNEINLLDYAAAAAAARAGNVIVIGGKAIASRLVCNGGNYGSLTLQARRQLQLRGFRFDDEFTYPAIPARWSRTVTKTADYTLVAADHGRLFHNIGDAGAIVFTLPALLTNIGFQADFLVAVDQTLTVASAEGDNIVTDHDMSADSIAFSTGSHKIGGWLRLHAVYLGTTAKWIVEYVNAVSTNTATVAT